MASWRSSTGLAGETRGGKGEKVGRRMAKSENKRQVGKSRQLGCLGRLI